MSKVSPRGAKQAVKAAPSAGRRALSKLDKRERIQAAAFELFTTLGYEATTTKAVAAQAEVTAAEASDDGDKAFDEDAFTVPTLPGLQVVPV